MRQDAHGVLRIADTRVTLDSLVDLYDQGASAEDIALSFQALDLPVVYAALGYYLGHRAALDNAKPAPRHESRPNGAVRQQRYGLGLPPGGGSPMPRLPTDEHLTPTLFAACVGESNGWTC